MKNKVFISYSHEADEELAAAIQTALQRIAKPLFKMYAIKVFRDQTNMVLSPNLWYTIENALAESEYFLYLASPQAADSEWVQKEIQYWVKNKPLDKLIIALTDGDIVWDDDGNEFDWENSNSMPFVFNGVYEGIPHFADFRLIKKEKNFTLNNPLFKREALLVASTIHNKSFAEISEEDEQSYKKIHRYRYIAIAVFALLLAGMSWFAWKSNQTELSELNQRKKAKEASIVASQNRIDLLKKDYKDVIEIIELAQNANKAKNSNYERLIKNNTLKADSILLLIDSIENSIIKLENRN